MEPRNLTAKKKLKKLIRFYRIYGIRRALNKAFGRLRHPYIKAPGFRKKPFVSVIGAGQFAFATICYFIHKKIGLVFLNTFDTKTENASSLAHYYRFRKVSGSARDLLENPLLKVLYISSNHASHSTYAIDAMQRGVAKIYIEKPIAVSDTQFDALLKAQSQYGSSLYAGYNRPYAKAIRDLKRLVQDDDGINKAFSVNFFISGHLIPREHWYRNPGEGTRICGNMGHWIDLTIHMLAWRSLPEQLVIQIAYSNQEEPDDNLCISLTSDQGDIISIMLSSRSEPFEGINETVNFQYGNIIAKIDDFRKMQVWNGDKLLKRRYYPKDVGHERAILQPFKKDNRNWDEVLLSTSLMLHIKEMVLHLEKESIFALPGEIEKLRKYKPGNKVTSYD